MSTLRRASARALMQFAALLDGADIIFHVFRRPAARMRDERVLWELAAKFGEESEHVADDALHIVLAARHDERRHLVPQQHARGDRFLILDAIAAFNHLVIKRARGAPADRRRDQNDIRPMHESLVDAIHLISRVHLRDRTWPGACARAF